MNKLKVKTFAEALSRFHQQKPELKKYLKDKRLTVAEKQIIQGWLWLADNKLDQILETIPKLSTNYDEIVESQKQLIWGIALNNKADFQEAKKHLERSVPALLTHGLTQHLFLAQTNLLILHYNQNDVRAMKANLEILCGLNLSTTLSKLAVIQSSFMYFSKSGEMTKALEALQLLNENTGKMSEHMRVLHLITKFNFFIAQKNFDECEKIVCELKRLKKYAFSANFRFIKVLLENLKDNSPIYIYERDFKDQPFLFAQLMVIKCLEENKAEEAEAHWRKLKTSCPELYGDGFEYLGHPCLFSLALGKMKNGLNQTLPDFSNMKISKELIVLEVLKSVDYPISKEKLFSVVWKNETPDKSNLNRLQKIISRLRESGHPIDFQKGCYFIEKSVKKPV